MYVHIFTRRLATLGRVLQLFWRSLRQLPLSDGKKTMHGRQLNLQGKCFDFFENTYTVLYASARAETVLQRLLGDKVEEIGRRHDVAKLTCQEVTAICWREEPPVRCLTDGQTAADCLIRSLMTSRRP